MILFPPHNEQIPQESRVPIPQALQGRGGRLPVRYACLCSKQSEPLQGRPQMGRLILSQVHLSFSIIPMGIIIQYKTNYACTKGRLRQLMHCALSNAFFTEVDRRVSFSLKSKISRGHNYGQLARFSALSMARGVITSYSLVSPWCIQPPCCFIPTPAKRPTGYAYM